MALFYTPSRTNTGFIKQGGDYDHQVFLGNVTGVTGRRAFGHGSSMSSGSSWSTIWPLDSSLPLYPFPQGSAVLNVVSTSTADNLSSDGAGAQLIKIDGLDSEFKKVTNIVSLTGTSSAASASSFSRINGAACISVGAYGGDNAGDITITTKSSDHTLAFIEATHGQSEQLVYTSPASATVIFTQANFFPQEGKSAGVNFRGRVRQNADDVSSPFSGTVTIGNITDEGGAVIFPVDTTTLPPKTDFVLQAQSAGGATPATISAVAGNFWEYTT